MPLVARVRLVGLRLQGWKSSIAPNFLTLIAACRKQHADNRSSGIDAATVLAVEEEALASISTIQVTDLAAQPRFAKRRHLLTDFRLAKNVLFEDVNELVTTTLAATIAFVVLTHADARRNNS